MASNGWSVQTSEVTVAAAATKTLLQICAANANVRERMTQARVAVRGGAAGDAAVLIELLRQTTAGTGGASATVGKANPSASETLQITAIEGAFSAEPTASTILDFKYVSPIQGEAVFSIPREVAGSGRLALRATTQTGVTSVKCKSIMEGDE